MKKRPINRTNHRDGSVTLALRGTKRHARPTDSVILNRIYRRQIRMDAKLTRTMRTLAEDFTRVIRQNDTLRGENETLKEMVRVRDEALNPLRVVADVPLQPWEPPMAPMDTSPLAVANAYMSRPKRQAG
jgi:hypothetical protein